jgi:hypothetical protein
MGKKISYGGALCETLKKKSHGGILYATLRDQGDFYTEMGNVVDSTLV